jgi:hypothetical protein
MKKIDPQEIQLRLETYVNDIINQIFPGNDMFNKLKSTTAKYWVKQNIWRMDTILNNFIDKDGLIDIEDTINFYVDSMFDENGKFSINLGDLIQGTSLESLIPNKTIIFSKNDLMKLFNIHCPAPTVPTTPNTQSTSTSGTSTSTTNN